MEIKEILENKLLQCKKEEKDLHFLYKWSKNQTELDKRIKWFDYWLEYLQARERTRKAQKDLNNL